MAAFISAVINAPLSAVLIIFEMTGNYEILLPLLISTVLSSTVARIIYPENIYSVKLFKRIMQKENIIQL
jgi:chloride channel protein, CIC family